MQFRQAGNTGIEVSVVGLGAEHVDTKPYEAVKEVVDAAIDHGVNFIEVFMPGEAVRTHIGNALAGRRDKVVIQGAIGSTDIDDQYDISRDPAICERYFENLLRCLRTDYIDIGMLFFLDSHEAIDAVMANGVYDYAQKLKKQGKIRAIGASAHNPDTARRAVEEGLCETLMFSVNPAFDLMPGFGDVVEMLDDGMGARVARMDVRRAELYRLCAKKGVGLIAMKSLAAGKLLSPDHTPFAAAMTPAQCIHYALTRPAAATVAVGCKTRREVELAVEYVDTPDAGRDYAPAVSRFRDDGKGGFSGACVYCNHCLPCPSGIDIAQLNKYLDMAMLDEKNIPPSVGQHYRSLTARGGDCVRCGSCEERCPFSVKVMDRMEKAAVLFGG